MNNFWQNLKQEKTPFFALAPMEGATDSIFRQIIASTGKPDVFFTEFTNVEGLFSKGASKVDRRLEYVPEEKPLIAQIWGLNPELFYKAAQMVAEKGFAGIDINMGCPQTDVTQRGACAGLIKNKPLAKEIIQAVKEGAESREARRACLRASVGDRDKGGGDRRIQKVSKVSRASNAGKSVLPISVKTRIGFSKIEAEEWIGFLLEQNLDALIVHGRTRKEMSKVPAHWDEIGKVVELRDKMKKKTVIIGNGDIKSREEGIEKAKKFRVDGIMIGRGVFENAWIFSGKQGFTPTVENRIQLLLKHLELYQREEGEKLPFHTLKKYFKIYIRDFDGAGELRARMMETGSVEEAKEVISKMVVRLTRQPDS